MVIIRVTDPTQEESEIIWPETLATLLTWPQDAIQFRDAFIGDLNRTINGIKNNSCSHVITWTGSQTDFSWLGKLWILAETLIIPPPRPSSRKMAIGMLRLLRYLKRLRILVEIKGAEKRPKGRTQTWKYLNFLECQNPKQMGGICDALGELFLVENLSGRGQVLLKLLLVNESWRS